MKIAFLAAGLKRNYRYTVEYLKKNLTNSNDLDVYILLDTAPEKCPWLDITSMEKCPYYNEETENDETYLKKLFGDKLKVLTFVNSGTDKTYNDTINNYILNVKHNLKDADITGNCRYHMDYGDDRIAEYPIKFIYNHILLYKKFDEYAKTHNIEYDYIFRFRLDRIKPINNINLGNIIKDTNIDIYVANYRYGNFNYATEIFLTKPNIYLQLLNDFLNKYGSFRHNYKNNTGFNFLCVPEYNFGNLLYMWSTQNIKIQSFNFICHNLKRDCNDEKCNTCAHYNLINFLP